ncbi:hypothetical protein ANN_02931 [Periplaneta americana]|uniref:Uncharacterized protein n=1 Tax=Periplaneta americana TaxID=6978 RepID=A0ABQ8TXM8_PERAM|nr:hypothetical protein ANN_02931 [Periplaneta americana]
MFSTRLRSSLKARTHLVTVLYDSIIWIRILRNLLSFYDRELKIFSYPKKLGQRLMIISTSCWLINADLRERLNNDDDMGLRESKFHNHTEQPSHLFVSVRVPIIDFLLLPSISGSHLLYPQPEDLVIGTYNTWKLPSYSLEKLQRKPKQTIMVTNLMTAKLVAPGEDDNDCKFGDDNGGKFIDDGNEFGENDNYDDC